MHLDELYAVLRDLKAGAISAEEAMARLERSPYWVWTAMDPTSKLLVVVEVGTRTLAMAQRVVHQLGTDGLKDYATALLTHFGYWRQPQRRQAKGPMPKPRWIPRPTLL
jgi:IS1 family transposase